MLHPYPAPFVTGRWTVRPGLKTLSRDGQEVRLGHKVMAVLVCLVEADGELVTKGQLVEQVWEGAFTTDEALATVVYELRKALGDDARQPRFVETIRKGGYRWLAETSPLERTPVARAVPSTTLPSLARPSRGRRASFAAVLLAAFATLTWLRPGVDTPSQTDSPSPSLALLSLTPFENECSANPGVDRLTDPWITETVDPQAEEAFDLASYFSRQGTALANQKAQSYFHQAIEHQPSYAAAHAGLAKSFVTSAEELPAPARQEALHRARQSAETALAMDSQQPVAHASLASISFRHAWDWRAAEDHFRRGRVGGYSSSDLTPDYAFYLAALGRHAEAIAAMRRLVVADPTAKQARWALGRVYYLARRFDDALVELAKARELDPTYLQAALLETEVLFATGRAEAAIEACEDSLRLAGDSAEQVAALTNAYQQAGLDGVLRCLIAREVERSQQGSADPVRLASLEARRGAAEPALAWLSQAFASRHQDLVWLKVDPAFDSLRHTAEYQDLIHRLGLGV